MADKKSAKYPFRWSDGSWHSRAQRTSIGSSGSKATTVTGTQVGTPKPLPSTGGVQAPAGRVGGTEVRPPAPAGGGGATGGAAAAAPPPIDPRLVAAYNNRVSANNTSYDATVGGYKDEEDRAATGFGFNITRDAAGNPFYDGSLAINPQDPFSKMGLLQRSYEQQRTGTSNSYASMGQRNSGAYERMVGENADVNKQNQDSLSKAFAELIAGYRKGRLGAYGDMTTGNSTAYGDMVTAALGG